MSEILEPPELGQELSEESIQETIKNWKRELPESFRECLYLEKDGPISLGEVLEFFDKTMDDLKQSEGSKNDDYITTLEKNVKHASNNFSLMFSTKAAEETISGDLLDPYGFQPFYINAKFHNAWNRMCELFPDDVKRAIEHNAKRLAGGDNTMSNDDAIEEESTSLNKLALYLIQQEDVMPSFICE